MIELAELRVFVAAAEERSFSRAGTRLHLSQSAISQNIQGLEKAFGVSLFVRHGRSVWLSEAGQALLPLAKDVLNASRLMEEAMNNLQSQIVGELVIGCSTTSGKYLLPTLVALYRREYPMVKVKFSILQREEVLQRLLGEDEEGCITIGMVSRHIDHQHIDLQPFFEDRVVLIIPPNHPWKNYGKALPADLLDQTIILGEPETGTTELLLEGLAQHGISKEMLNSPLEISNTEAAVFSVEAGIGVAFVSELAAAHALALGRIRSVEIEGLDLHRTIYLARNTQRPLSRAQERFWSFAQEQRDHLARIMCDPYDSPFQPGLSIES
ncbi:MAG TPA: LysR substrate-binding domain-containing protein [Anaerolineaceae bacterium]|nr:LysR substrate-binding domain-containing protein [Anaerolineaceae bacterium]